MKKALFVATIVEFLASFEKSDIKVLQSLGYEVHYATNYGYDYNIAKFDELNATGAIKHNICFTRNPYSKSNINAYKKLKKLIKQEKFDLVHCHTPVGGVLGRMVAHSCHVPVVMYTAHGFHFFRGCPLKNRLLYYPIEKFMSCFTDIEITINNEDYEVAKAKFHAKNIKRIHGVGIDIDKFKKSSDCRESKRQELGVLEDEIMLLAVGELDRDKNHIEILHAMIELAPKGYKLFIAGSGNLDSSHRIFIAENGLQDSVKLLGYRRDISELLNAADIYVFPSLFEGLSVALMEAVAVKVPVVCSEVRGNVDTVITPESYFSPKDVKSLVSAIEGVSRMSDEQKTELVDKNYQNLLKFRLSEVQKEMTDIYKIADSLVEEARREK